MSNTRRKNALYLLAAIMISAFLMPSIAMAKDEQQATAKERPRHERGDFNKKAEWMLEKIEQDDPEKADRLRKLRDENSEKFKETIHQHMKEKFKGKGGGWSGPGGKKGKGCLRL